MPLLTVYQQHINKWKVHESIAIARLPEAGVKRERMLTLSPVLQPELSPGAVSSQPLR